MQPIGASQTVFVGDTRVEEVITSFPDLSFCVNPRWQIDGPLGSLMSAPIEGGTAIFVNYTDVVYGSEIVESLKGRDEDAVLVVDRAWRDRYSGRPLVDLRRGRKSGFPRRSPREDRHRRRLGEAVGEFVGLIKVGPRATTRLTSGITWPARPSPPRIRTTTPHSNA